MKRIVQKIKIYSKLIDLSQTENDDLRTQLVYFMKENPKLSEFQKYMSFNNVDGELENDTDNTLLPL
jgi:hypothetical protein